VNVVVAVTLNVNAYTLVCGDWIETIVRRRFLFLFLVIAFPKLYLT